MDNRGITKKYETEWPNITCKIVFILLVFSCTTTKQKQFSEQNILTTYYGNQKYTSDVNGVFLKETEKSVVDSLAQNYSTTNEILVVKEYCNQYNLSGSFFSINNNTESYFYRKGKSSNIIFGEPSYNGASNYYQRIKELFQNDSLSYYEKKNKTMLDSDDENCWLYVIHLKRGKHGFMQKRYTFSHPFAFRKEIVK